MAQPDVVALDACALIHWMNPESPYQAAMTEWMQLALIVNQVQMVGSTALLIEARGGGHLAPNPVAEERIRKVLLDARFMLVNIDRVLSLEARQLAIDHKLSTWDAVHLATAIQTKVDVLLTTDPKLLKIGSIKGVAILEPYQPGPASLFDA